MSSITPDQIPERTLFVRKATGLVRGWSAWDSFIYANFVISVVAVGFGFAFTSGVFIPSGGIMWALIISAAFIVFEAIAWSAMIATMPRAGGDYVWQTRVFGGGVGFVLAATGWWFILWHWVPIYAQIFAVEVMQPILTWVGFTGTAAFHADWWAYSATNGDGIFVSSLLTAAFAAAVIAAGMRVYARFQKWCFYGGVLGLLIMIIVFAVHTPGDFASAFNKQAHHFYGAPAGAYSKVVSAGQAAHLSFGSLWSLPFSATFLLMPFLAFYNLWPNWGATLYGEIRGASDFRKNVYAMAGALAFTTAGAIAMFIVMQHAMGKNFYNLLSASYWAIVPHSPVSAFPYPGMLVTFFFGSKVLAVLFLLLLSLWWFGWVGSVFLSSTRVIFAAAFDRILPEWAASVNRRTAAPLGALALMFIPSIIISALYAYSTQFYKYTLDATMVIAVTYAGTALAAAILPWRRNGIFRASPIAHYRVLGIPLISLAGVVFFGFLVFLLYEWLFKSIYGVNNHSSLIYMGILYVVALAIYVTARLVRRRQGIDLSLVNSEIPVE
jgi:APA family basic amino acid/polyamine antiporter